MNYIKGIAFMPHPPVIIPEVGKGKEQEIKATTEGMQKVAQQIKQWQPELIICISPHGNTFRDAISVLDEKEVNGSLKSFGYPHQVQKSIATDFKKYLQAIWLAKGVPHIFISKQEAHDYQLKLELDHGALVPLYFIDKQYTNYQLVHITPGLLPPQQLYKAGVALAQAINKFGRSTVIVASGDLSHSLLNAGPYQYKREGPLFDNMVKEYLIEQEFLKLITISPKIYEPAGQCGLYSYALALGAIDGMSSSTTVHSYEGTFGVGYLTAALHIKEEKTVSLLSDIESMRQYEYLQRLKSDDQYQKLARSTIERYAQRSESISWEKYIKQCQDKEFIERLSTQKAGTFVSIHSHGQLRGCIGTTGATQENIAREIIYNAIQAAFYDPRFTPIEVNELPDLEIKVDILHPIESIRSEEELNIEKYGVVVEKGSRRGLLLPNLEGINSVKQQVQIAKQKAGIGSWENVNLYRFEVERHE